MTNTTSSTSKIQGKFAKSGRRKMEKTKKNKMNYGAINKKAKTNKLSGRRTEWMNRRGAYASGIISSIPNRVGLRHPRPLRYLQDRSSPSDRHLRRSNRPCDASSRRGPGTLPHHFPLVRYRLRHAIY